MKTELKSNNCHKYIFLNICYKVNFQLKNRSILSRYDFEPEFDAELTQEPIVG